MSDPTQTSDSKCGCGSGGCSQHRGCCWGKAAMALLLLLLGGAGGYFLGRGCGAHRMAMCPMPMSAPAAQAPQK
jgi:hypothetical protein